MPSKIAAEDPTTSKGADHGRATPAVSQSTTPKAFGQPTGPYMFGQPTTPPKFGQPKSVTFGPSTGVPNISQPLVPSGLGHSRGPSAFVRQSKYVQSSSSPRPVFTFNNPAEHHQVFSDVPTQGHDQLSSTPLQPAPGDAPNNPSVPLSSGSPVRFAASVDDKPILDTQRSKPLVPRPISISPEIVRHLEAIISALPTQVFACIKLDNIELSDPALREVLREQLLSGYNTIFKDVCMVIEGLAKISSSNSVCWTTIRFKLCQALSNATFKEPVSNIRELHLHLADADDQLLENTKLCSALSELQKQCRQLPLHRFPVTSSKTDVEMAEEPLGVNKDAEEVCAEPLASSLNVDVESLLKKYERLTHELENAKLMIQRKEQQLKDAKSSAEAEETKKGKLIDHLEGARQVNLKRAEQAETDLRKAQQDLRHAQKECKELQVQYEQVKDQFRDQNSKISTKDAIIKKLKDDLSDLKKKVEQLQTTLGHYNLESEHDQLESERTQRKEAEEKVRVLETKVGTLEGNVKSLEQNLAQRQAADTRRSYMNAQQPRLPSNDELAELVRNLEKEFAFSAEKIAIVEQEVSCIDNDSDRDDNDEPAERFAEVEQWIDHIGNESVHDGSDEDVNRDDVDDEEDNDAEEDDDKSEGRSAPSDRGLHYVEDSHGGSLELDNGDFPGLSKVRKNVDTPKTTFPKNGYAAAATRGQSVRHPIPHIPRKVRGRDARKPLDRVSTFTGREAAQHGRRASDLAPMLRRERDNHNAMNS